MCVFPDGMTGLSCSRSQTWLCGQYARLTYKITLWYIVLHMSCPESLDTQFRFVQQIALEVVHVDGYNHCLHDRSYA
jgi:hypothetical protein